ncbi:glycosyltransferase family 2 protein [Aeromonas piscicola]|uniref:glycosyltransferase family 2 protein n=1 Tax=Aeromonas piscicola TaxID=600645 RepID=UPI0028E54DE5|nr:glycosyltransferase family 2 protein [Aeromonas piscicola]
MNAIGAIFKNEGPYISEWVAYHKSLGFDRIYIADNVSNDGSSEILAKLHQCNEITRIEYKTVEGVKPQVPAYNLILEQAKKECEYIAFIDADEFLYFENDSKLCDLTGLINSSESIGAVAINWCVYGSSNAILPGEGLVIERFDHRSDKECHLNLHYKSFLKTSAINGTHGGGVHHFQLHEGYHYVMTDGSRLDSTTGISDHISWDLCRLNHYVIKSASEFFHKKMARGRAAGNNSDLNKYFFINHDKNHVKDSVDSKLIAKVKYEKSELDAKLGMTFNISKHPPLYRHPNSLEARSYIDSIKEINSVLKIDGWCYYSGGNLIESIILVVNKKEIVVPIEYIKTNRPDVVLCGISNYELCGFSVSFDLSTIVCSTTKVLDFYAVDYYGDVIHDISVENKTDVLKRIFLES